MFGDDTIWQVALRPLSIARMLWKQRLTIAALWLLLGAATVVIILRLPAIYRAETLILVDSQKIPEKFVSTTVSADLREQLATLSQQILSSSRLSKVIEKFDLYAAQRRSGSMEEALERMRADVQIRVEKGWTDEHPGAFRVSFQGTDPILVTHVVNQLGSLFVDESRLTRENHAEGTLQFIQSQLEQAKKNLDEEEKRVSLYKLEHNGELPEQEASLTASLAQLNIQLQGNQEAISRAYSNQVALQGGIRLAQSIAEVSQRLNQTPPESDRKGAPSSQPNGEKPEDILKGMQAELDALLITHTESYPRVRLLRSSIARLQALEERERLAAAIDPEHAENLKSQLAAVDRELKERAQENHRLVQESDTLKLHLSRIPIREQEMAALTRDYEISKTNYKSLLDKFYAADMSANMERNQKAEPFTVLEPASVPQRPVKPNRPLLGEVGGAFVLAAGLLVGLIIEIKKNQVLGEWELPSGTSVYGRVPTLALGRRAREIVRARIRTRGRLNSLLSPLRNGRHHDADLDRGDLIPEPNSFPPLKALVSLPPSSALAIQPTSALSTVIKRQVRTIRPESPALCLHNPNLRALEQYRIARTKIEYDRRQPKLIVVSSACPGDGKTISAINLATVFAMRSDVQILMVEADFRHSCLAELLGIPPRPGLADVLCGRSELSETIVRVEQLPNLCVLPAGTYTANVTEMLGTPAWRSLCISLREQFAFTLFDAPPVGPVADYELIEKNCDGVILVARADHTDRSLFRNTHGMISPDKMLGILLNGVDDWFLWKASESYYTPAPF